MAILEEFSPISLCGEGKADMKTDFLEGEYQRLRRCLTRRGEMKHNEPMDYGRKHLPGSSTGSVIVSLSQPL
jgi:hypothetical protein